MHLYRDTTVYYISQHFVQISERYNIGDVFYPHKTSHTLSFAFFHILSVTFPLSYQVV